MIHDQRQSGELTDETAQDISSFSEGVRKAANIIDLRAQWNISSHSLGLSYPNADQRTSLVDGLVSALSRMQLDLSLQDERVVSFISAAERMLTETKNGTQVPAIFFRAYNRILSGADPASLDTLSLLPLEGLVLTDLTYPLSEVALSFTQDPQYTLRTEYPRKALRSVKDPSSPYWGFRIYTDTFPEGPNITLQVPTGTIERQSMIDMIHPESTSNPFFSSGPQDTPSMYVAQYIHLGHKGSWFNPVDTVKSAMVGRFLESIKTES